MSAMAHYGYSTCRYSSRGYVTPDYFNPDYLTAATTQYAICNAYGSPDNACALRNARQHLRRHGENASRDAVRFVREHEERRRAERAEREGRRRDIHNARRTVDRHGSLASERRPDAVRAVREYEERRRDEHLARSLRYQQECEERDRRDHDREERRERRRIEERAREGVIQDIPGNYARRLSRAGVDRDGSSYYVNRFGVRQDY